MKATFIFLFLLLLFSCQNSEEKQLEKVLTLSGNNRPELEKVLEHYKENEADSLKLRAAKFLIINMPGHQSYTGKDIEEYYVEAEKIIFSDRKIDEQVNELNNLLLEFPSDDFEFKEDYSVIKASYLIQSIDAAFDDWQQGRWARGITFDEFCEYMLPYKCVEFQAFDDWRNVLKPIANDTLGDFSYNDIWNKTPYHAAEAINIKLRDTVIVDLKKPLKWHALYKIPFWCNIPSNSCETRTNTALAIMRSKGFAVSYDFVLQWPTKAHAHSWLSILIDHDRRMVCEGGHEPFLATLRPGECKGKVYRRTYSPNSALVRLNKEAGSVPSTLRNVFIKDVTDEYATTIDPVFPVLSGKRERKEKYAYLAVFDNAKWVPICFSEIKDSKQIVFDKIEKGAVYLPVYYINGRVRPFNYPALLNEKGELEFLNPDNTSKRSISLKRKYPLTRKAFTTALRLKHSMFQAAHKEDFSDAVTVHTFKEYSVSGSINVSDTTKYRYWRYICPKPYRCNIAELMFLDKENKKLTGTIIGSEERSKNPHYSRSAAFDLDPLTFFASKTLRDGWVGLDLGKPESVGRIGYMTRNDDNNVRIGDTYELFYWDMDWVSLGKQIADDFSLTFHHVPQNALLLLRDLTRGTDERIFLYKDVKQIWY